MRPLTPNFSVEDFRKSYDYDPETGHFYCNIRQRPWSSVRRPCGHPEKATGYRRIRVFGDRLPAYKLAWFYVYGEWPDLLDHINGDRDDNRIANLRLATRRQNSYNRKSTGKNRLKGAHWNRFRGYWQSYIKVDGRSIRLGKFSTEEEAHAAYCKAAREYHGEFASFK